MIKKALFIGALYLFFNSFSFWKMKPRKEAPTLEVDISTINCGRVDDNVYFIRDTKAIQYNSIRSQGYCV